MLAALLWRGLSGAGERGWRSLGAMCLLVAAYAATDEFHQAFVPGRHADPWDWVVDVAGAGLALWLLHRRAR